MKVLLIVPEKHRRSENMVEKWPSLGVCYIAAILKRKSIIVEIIDCFVENLKRRELESRILKFEPNIVGFSFGTEARFEAISQIKMARKLLPEALIIAGGPHPRWASDDLLRNVPEVDLICFGEGEIIIPKVCEAWNNSRDFSQIRGLVFVKNKQIFKTDVPEFIDDLDSVPLPARDLVRNWQSSSFLDVPGYGKKLRTTHIMTSRGCPFRCNFCSESNKILRRKVRLRSAENVFMEMEYLKRKGIQVISIYDSIFTMSKERAYKICRMMRDKRLNVLWQCSIRVDMVDRELLKEMKSAGCFRIYMGIESGSQRIIDEIIHKKITIEQVKNVSKWCREIGINPFGLFMFSHPTETFEEAKQTVELMKYVYSCGDGRNNLGLGVLKIYPGTMVEKYANDISYFPKNFSWTKRYKQILRLPMQGGDVPILIDKLTISQLSELIFEYQYIGRDPLLRRLPSILRDILVNREIKKYLIMVKELIKLRFKKLKIQFYNKK